MQAKQSLGYAIEQDKYLHGMCEIFEGAVDKAMTPEQTIALTAALGAKSMRIWMHHKSLLTRENGRIVFRPGKKEQYRGYVIALKERGVTHLTSMNHSYLYPDDFPGDRTSENEIPLPGTDCYRRFLADITESYAIVSAAFPEIAYFEVGNETNLHRFLAKPGWPGKDGPKEGTYDERYCYTKEEKAAIMADICWYANRGVKRGNPAAYVVFPGLTPLFGYPDMADYFDLAYAYIRSGRAPAFQPADTDPDNYFQVLAWHPYNFSGEADIFVNGCNTVYEIIKKNGDEGKKVFLTEFGYHDFDLIKHGYTLEEADKKQAEWLYNDFQAFRRLPYVETVHVFRLYDWVAGPGIEIDFGMFHSSASEQGLTPKAKGLAYFRSACGEDADPAGLYRYAKQR